MKNDTHKKTFITQAFNIKPTKPNPKKITKQSSKQQSQKTRKNRKEQNTQLRLKKKEDPENIKQRNIQALIKMHQQNKMKQNVVEKLFKQTLKKKNKTEEN